MKNKMLIFKIVIVLLVVSGVVLFFVNRSLSSLEKVKIDEFNDEIVDYLEEISDSDDKGKYISFAIKYLSDKENKYSFSDDEIINTINKYYNLDYDINSLEKIGVTSKMAEEGITHEIDKYTYNNVLTKKDIASINVIKYSQNSVKKSINNKYVVSFKRLVVDNPYDVLNYYSSLNQDTDAIIDTKDLNKYLDGEGSIKNIKKYITEDTIDNYGKIDGEIKVTYIIKNDKLLIDNIE